MDSQSAVAVRVEQTGFVGLLTLWETATGEEEFDYPSGFGTLQDLREVGAEAGVGEVGCDVDKSAREIGHVYGQIRCLPRASLRRPHRTDRLCLRL